MPEQNISYSFKVNFEQIGRPEDKTDKNKIIAQVFKNS
jgi:hypothetical protein